jgi:hypothetical protein
MTGRENFSSARFEYSDILLNIRPGIVAAVSESNSYLQHAPTTMTYNYTPTVASPDPLALTAIRVQQIHETIERFATSLTADFKAQYQRHRINVDVGGSYRFAPRLSGLFSVRNVLNEPFIRMEQVGTNPAVAQFFQDFGVAPTVGVRTTF